MPDSRIAVCIDNIESDYHVEMLTGILRGARSSHAQTLIVAGGWLTSPKHPTLRNFVYDLLPQAKLDGILVLAGSLSHACGLDHFEQWLRGLGKIPIVCIGLDLPGWPCVHVDNGQGMYAAVSHLIEQHGHRRIAFVRGPNESGEAMARFEAYQRALNDHGLSLDQRMLCMGQGLNRDEGVSAVREYFDHRGLQTATLDAIIGVNDEVALGVLEALTLRGIQVPEQVAVIGFDDTMTSRFANPPLTTVAQHVELQGYSAARRLLDAIEQRRLPESEKLASTAVIRASCGCRITFQNDSRSLADALPGLTRKLHLVLIEHRSRIKIELGRAAGGRVAGQAGWEDRLLNALAMTIEQGSPDFIYVLEQTTRRLIMSGGDALPIHDVLTTLRLEALSRVALQPELRSVLEDIFQEARLALTRVGLGAYRERDQAATMHLRSIAKACLDAIGSRNAASVALALKDHLPALGIADCSVSRFVQQRTDDRSQLECVARVSSGLHDRSKPFMPAAQLGLDDTLQHRSAVVIEPLEYNRRVLGLATFPWGANNPVWYEQLRELLSPAVGALPE